jgi:hypothetical protein
MTFPAELDCSLYRSLHPDLAGLDDAQLFEHWARFGLAEGRTASQIQDRSGLMSLLEPCRSILEIGVFDCPSLEFLRSEDRIIHYADWLDKESLKARAELIPGRRPETVPDIQYLLSQGYAQITDRYDAVVSHHCIEHQPNLIQHLHDIRSILKPGGWYLLSIPDKRRCFDHFIPESTLVDIVEAFYSQRVKPGLKSVIEHRCLTRHDYQSSTNPYASSDPGMRACLDRAVQEFAANDYVDVHCWQFTPHGFKQLYTQLNELGFVPPCKELRVYCAGVEFYVALAF